MQIAILVSNIIIALLLAVLVYFMRPRKKPVTGGWIKPQEAEPLDDDDSVIPLTDKYEQDYVNNQEPEL